VPSDLAIPSRTKTNENILHKHALVGSESPSKPKLPPNAKYLQPETRLGVNHENSQKGKMYFGRQIDSYLPAG
jgi:hypothetical protein